MHNAPCSCAGARFGHANKKIIGAALNLQSVQRTMNKTTQHIQLMTAFNKCYKCFL